MVTGPSTITSSESQPDPGEAVGTLTHGGCWMMNDEEFARMKRSIERSLDDIDQVIKRCLSLGSGIPAASATNR
jgi:hypothetical protein